MRGWGVHSSVDKKYEHLSRVCCRFSRLEAVLSTPKLKQDVLGPEVGTHLTLAPVQLSQVVRSTGSSSSPPRLLRLLFLIGDCWLVKLTLLLLLLLSPGWRPLPLDSDNISQDGAWLVGR